jgi:hypothetical protein
MDSKLDLRHAELVRERMMNFRGEVANHFVALGHLANRDRETAVGFRGGILDDSERDNIRIETGILNVPQRLDNRVF